MIVTCTKCQAKFRVADEKIGPRGAKVRCSRCQTIFAVHPDLGTVPSRDEGRRAAPRPTPGRVPGEAGEPRRPELDFEPRPAAPSERGPSLATLPAGWTAGGASGLPAPPAAPPPLPSPPRSEAPFSWPHVPQVTPSADPSASAAPDSCFAPPDATASASPGGLAARPGAAAADPFAPELFGARAPDPFAAPAPDPFAAPAPDPFAAPAPDPFAALARDPFGAAPEPFSAAAPHLPLTDLSDLLGARGALGVTGEPAPAASSGAFSVPDENGLSLEDPPTPHLPLAAEAPAGALGAPASPYPPDPFDVGAADIHAFDRSRIDFGASAGDAWSSGGPPGAPAVPELASDAAEFLELGAPPAAAREPRPARRAAPETEGAPPAAAVRAPPRERVLEVRRSWLHAVVVNAVALAALLFATVAMLVVWRTKGPLELTSLRPAAVLAALRGEGASGPFAAHEIRSGLYERERGPPVLFVRGLVVSRAPDAVPGARVAVEIVRGGQVIARAETVAGAVPTAEELYRAPDAAALASVARAAAARAPAQIRPGDAIPFLVAIAEHPADLDGASLRVEIAATAGRAAR
jgi:predicted Zn finger-like uncharacterized protein